MQTENQVSNLAFNLISNLDLDAYSDVQTGAHILLDPKTKEKTNQSITLASPEHQARKTVDLKRARATRASYNQTGKVLLTDPLEEIEDETDYLVACTLGWNLIQGGAPLEFSPAAARKLYTDPKKQWVRQQVKDAINKGDIFIESSAKP